MITIVELFGSDFIGAAGCTDEQLSRLESALGVDLPSDYRAVLLLADGGEGAVGEIHLSLWKASDVVALNDYYAIRSRMGSRFVGIGSDGGDYCFALDLRVAGAFVVIPFGALGDEEVVQLAESFMEGILSIRDGRITGDDF